MLSCANAVNLRLAKKLADKKKDCWISVYHYSFQTNIELLETAYQGVAKYGLAYCKCVVNSVQLALSQF